MEKESIDSKRGLRLFKNGEVFPPHKKLDILLPFN